MTCELAFEEVGSGSPLLLLHGLFGSSTNWRSIARTLGAEYRVVAVDLRNHGASPWAGTMGYDEMAADVAALIDRLGLEAPTILGHSMGGKVAMTLALTDAAHVGRLIVVDIAPVTYGDRFSPHVDAMLAAAPDEAKTRDEIKQKLAATVTDERVVAFLMTNLVRRSGPDGDGYAWRINLDAIQAGMTDISAFPAALDGLTYDGPVTVIDGEQSTYITDEGRERFRAHFPQARFETVASAGHWLHADQPVAFVAAVRRAFT
jgi:esterase